MPKPLPVIDVTAPVCCAPVAAAPMTSAEAIEVAVRLKALADPTRLRLLSLLLAAPGREACTCELAPSVGVTEATVSHHLGQLRKAGLVASERRGLNVWYRPVPAAIEALADVLSVWTPRQAGHAAAGSAAGSAVAG